MYFRLGPSTISAQLGGNSPTIALGNTLSDWAKQSVPPIARWVNAYADTVEGDSYEVNLVAFESSKYQDVAKVDFYLDGSYHSTATARSSVAGPMVGDTVQAYRATLDTSGWAVGSEHVVTAEVVSSYGTVLSLSGNRTQDELPHPRAAYVPQTGEASPSWSVTVAKSGLHGLKLYKGQEVITSTISGLSATISDLTTDDCPAPVIVLTDSNADPGQYWTASLGSGVSAALADSYITIRGSAENRGTVLLGNDVELGDSNIQSSIFNLKLENITFDKTARVGANKDVYLKNCESNRGLVPWSSSVHGNPPGTEGIAWEAGTGEFSDYYKKAGTNQWLAYSGGIPNGGDTNYTNILKFGNPAAGTVYHSCKFTNYLSLYKRADVCWDCESEFAWLDTYANVGAVIGCSSWNMPYGYNPVTSSQYHNDILQNASNMVNAMFYSIRSYKRQTANGDSVDDLWGNQAQFFSFRDLDARDSLWTGFVFKDVLFIGSDADSQGQFALGLYNALVENVTIIQEKDEFGSPGKGLNWTLADGTVYTGDPYFEKYRWGHLASSTIPNKTGLLLPIPYSQTDSEYIPQIEKFVTFKNVVLAIPQFPDIATDDTTGSGLRNESYTYNGITKSWLDWHADSSLVSVYADAIGPTMSFSGCYFVGGTQQGGSSFSSPSLPSGILSNVPASDVAGAPSRLGGPTRNAAWFSSYAGLS